MSGEVLQKSNGLPPNDAFLFLPKSLEERWDTPLDQNGIVDIPATINLVKTAIDPNYEWPKNISLHHFQWPEPYYELDREIGKHHIPSTFRNLPISTGVLFREFENVLHRVTLPPKVPDNEVMINRIESWNVVKSLFLKARKTIQWQKIQRRRRELILKNPGIIKEGFNGEDVIGEEIMHEILETHFNAYEDLLEQQDSIPEQHRIIDVSGPPHKVAKQLGKYVARKNIDYRWQIAS